MKNGNGHPALKVLLIDDSIDDEELIKRELGRTYKVILKRVRTEAALALELDQRSWDVVICDYLMPHLTALRALEVLKASVQDIPFICFSGTIDERIAVDIMQAGADDFISKEKMARLTLAIKRELKHKRDHLQDQLNLEESYIATIEAFGSALELRDHFTQGHTVRVTEITLRLARKMSITGKELVDIHRGALLHDIGKIGIPDLILLKSGPLSVEERKIMEMHPQLAYNMLKPISFLEKSIAIPYCHHERWDGKGYPNGLKGTDIPLHARIFSVIDNFDAMTTDRPYRLAFPTLDVLVYIAKQRETLFDPDIVETFLKMIKNDTTQRPQ
ncbi:MAG: HD domain-containing protein [Chloroflexota bacterium]|nr:HD domain-containing protein [Chloroflexota bacterium]